MLISEWKDTSGAAMTPAQLQQWLLDKASAMHQRGWTVIGSYCKTPNLHPWKDTERGQLLQWALEDVSSLAANSLNLRLLGSGVIALDCDFHDPSIMPVFVSELCELLGLQPKDLYSCKGTKGGKLFFRYSKQTIKDKPPRRLGPIAYSKGFHGDATARQEIEIKHDLSTFAGIYGVTTVVNSQGAEADDYIIYSTLEGCSYIGDASPNDLQVLTQRDLQAIADLFTSLMHRGGFVDCAGAAIEPITYSESITAAVAAYLGRLLLEDGNAYDYQKFVLKAVCDKDFERVIVPYYSYLHLDEACAVIRRMFRGGPPVASSLEAEIIGLIDALKRRNFRYIFDLGGPFIVLTKRYNDRIRQEAQARGLISESMTMDLPELFALLRENKGAQ